MNWKIVGEIYNNDHPSTPIVVGDLETLRASWSSELDGDPPEGLCLPDLDSRAPHLFSHGDELWLLAEDDDFGPIEELFTLEELIAAVSAPENEVTARHEVPVTSGHLGIALAHIDGSDLPPLPDGTTGCTVLTAEDDEDTKALIVAPVQPGRYEVTVFAAVDVGIRKPKYEEEPENEDARLFLRARIRRMPAG